MAAGAARPGRAAGAFCCAAAAWLCVVAAVTLEVTLNFDALAIQAGLQPAPGQELSAAVEGRRLSAAVHMIGPLLQLVIALTAGIVSCVTCYVHWSCYIKPTPDKYIPRHAVIPEQLTGSFKYPLFDCFGDVGTCCCFTWCPSCMMADMWYRTGWIHQTLKPGGANFASYDQSCPGWRWFAGMCGHCILMDMAGCFVPCFIAALRGGVSFVDGGDGGLGDVTPFRQLFKIVPHDGFSTFCNDCCLICWCGPCVGTQEYRQVMDALGGAPLEVRAPVPAAQGQVVGAPVVGQPVVVWNEKGAPA